MRVIIPALGYATELAVTLPAWRALLPGASIVVMCGDYGEASGIDAAALKVTFWKTDAWHGDRATFNKAAALDVGLRSWRLAIGALGEVCIVADADVVPFGALPEHIEPDTLYGCARYQCDTPEQLEAYRADVSKAANIISPERHGLPLIQPRTRIPRAFTPAEAAAMCVGYFQMFRYSPPRRFGSFPTAGGYDAAFRRQFPRRVGLTDFHVLHLGAPDRRNWTGRVVPPWPAGVTA